MTIKKLSIILGFAALLPASTAFAGKPFPPTVTTSGVAGSATDTVNRGYAGLKWTLGDGVMPGVVLGYRHARVQSNGDTEGGDVSFSFKLAGGYHPDKLRAKYFNGQVNFQGEVGGGYDFTKGLFAGVSAEFPYSNLGVDYLFKADSAWEPYFILNTMKKYDKPQGGTTTTTTSCPTGYYLSTGNGLCYPD